MIQKQKHRNRTTKNDPEKNNNIPSPTSTTVIEDEENSIQENIMTTKDKGDAYGQQFAVVTPAQTELSPPRRERKDSQNNKPLVQAIIEQEHQKKIRSVFSLSPFQENGSSIQTTPESHFHSHSSSSESSRTLTPFQGHTPTLNQIWRGPTPPWTQQPPSPRRQTSTASS
jgi:hypothetical protein